MSTLLLDQSFSYRSTYALQLMDPNDRSLVEQIKELIFEAKESISSFLQYAFKDQFD